MQLTISRESIPLSDPFTITGYTFREIEVVLVTIADRSATGCGEASGVYYLGDDVDHVMASVERVRREIEAGIDRARLLDALPAGGARNAVDCALWDLEAKTAGRPVWKLAGLAQPIPLRTTYTIPANGPGAMAEKALSYAQAKSLKLKLTGELPLDAERVRAVRRARPDVWIAVDGNQGFGPDLLAQLMPDLVDCRVSLVEQPCARGRDSGLDGFRSPIPLAADESAQDSTELEPLVGRYDIVNIKLDKCGGLTAGLLMAAEARRLGLGVMVGNMIGTSLAMAPAWILGQRCDVNDLDGTLFIARDREPVMVFDRGAVFYPESGWGSPK